MKTIRERLRIWIRQWHAEAAGLWCGLIMRVRGGADARAPARGRSAPALINGQLLLPGIADPHKWDFNERV